MARYRLAIVQPIVSIIFREMIQLNFLAVIYAEFFKQVTELRGIYLLACEPIIHAILASARIDTADDFRIRRACCFSVALDKVIANHCRLPHGSLFVQPTIFDFFNDTGPYHTWALLQREGSSP
jgi:hypothetical protein